MLKIGPGPDQQEAFEPLNAVAGLEVDQSRTLQGAYRSRQKAAAGVRRIARAHRDSTTIYAFTCLTVDVHLPKQREAA